MANTAINSEKNNSFNFWLAAGLLAVITVLSLTRDIDRPFCGLHSWAEASTAWVARAHVKYGFGYTKGVCTWAVGNPPPETPTRYWDHPQLSNILVSLLMRVTGTGERTIRIYRAGLSALGLLIFVKLVRKLTDDTTALLAGLFIVIFPLVQYFGMEGWLMPLGFLSFWYYIAVLEKSEDKTSKLSANHIGLALCIFFNMLFGWSGFFFAMAIGVHYVFRCLFRKKYPNKLLLAILILAPATGLLINFTVMAAGYSWNIQKIVDLYKWRSAKGEMPEFLWGKWFAKFWEHALTNFTLPVLLLVIGYLTLGQLFIWTNTEKKEDTSSQTSRKFPYFWLFLMPWVFQLLILRGCLWRHQSWEAPMMSFMAIATALSVLIIKDQLSKINHKLSSIVMIFLISFLVLICLNGGNDYYSIQWQPLSKINMFKTLNQAIPSDKSLLSFEDLIVNQHPSKGGFYRPEYAYYLDREVVQATSPEEIQKYASTGQYPYYLIPNVPQLSQLITPLREKYPLFKYIPGDPGERKNGKFVKAGMPPYLILDLQQSGAIPENTKKQKFDPKSELQ
ncbi:MAG: glycosyltransferase family 39 protein [Sedimentisphaerales bacterium]|nr:glycosyltransferase family 39 protein [Sedimentisphaerales bacterium]